MPTAIESLAEQVLERARALSLMIATAESCTGGLVAAALTSIAGSSDVFERGFVTYSNEAKEEMLGIDPALIAANGAVSPEVAIAMAACALRQSRAQLSVAVTGIAGPDGGSAEKPVGLVHFAAAKALSREGDAVDFAAIHHEERFGGIGRAEVRAKSVETSLRLLLRAADLD
ncbi:MAG: CinA family protein [Rhodomicrobium sp.]